MRGGIADGLVIPIWIILLFIMVLIELSVFGSGHVNTAVIHGHHCIVKGEFMSQTISCQWK